MAEAPEAAPRAGAPRGPLGHAARFALALAPFAALVAVLMLGLGRDPSHVPSPFVGKELPAFSAPVLGGGQGEYVSTSDFRGRVWVLNVWASWCAPCLLEHPQVTMLSESGLEVVGLNYKDASDDATTWLAEHGDPFQLSLADRDGVVGIDLGVYGVPETYVIDAGGIVLHKHIGPMAAADAEEVLRIASGAGGG